MGLRDKVVYLSVNQVRKAVALCIMAQDFMAPNKRFGALVWGQSGIGKNGVTDGLAEFFTEKTGESWGFQECNVSSMNPEDLQGIPVLNKQASKISYFIEYDMKPDSKGIFRVDELDRPAYFQNLIAMAKFGIDRTMSKSLPLGWFVLGLANGVSDAGTQELTEHLKGRFCHLYISTNSTGAKKAYKDHLEKRDLPDSILQLLKLEPVETRDEFEPHAVYNYRTLEYAGAILKAYDVLKSDGADFSDVLYACLAGCIGMHCASALIRVHELQGLPDLETVCNNPATSLIPDDLSLRHKYITTLCQEAKGDCNLATKLLNYLVRLPNEVARYGIEIITTTCPDVMKSPVYHKWVNRI